MFDLQKASMLKRASAWLLDVILLSVLATGFALLLSAAFGYDNYNDNLQRYYTEYEQLYGIDFNISDEEYLALGEEDRLRYADAYAKLNDDADVSRAFSIIIQLSLAIMSLSVLLAYMALEFAIPVLWLKNGQTIGKKIFGLAVMRTDSVRVKPITMLIRTLLGKYTIETMAPLLIIFLILFGSLGTVGLIMLAALALLYAVVSKYARYQPDRTPRRPLAAKLGATGFLIPLLLPLSLCLVVSYALRAERNLNRYLHDYD